MKDLVLSILTWVLEFVCVTFRCTDYLEAIVCLPFICCGIAIEIAVVVAIKRCIVWSVMQFKTVRRLDCMALLIILKWRSAALRFIEKKLEGWYEKTCYHIIQKKRRLLIEHRRAMRRLELLNRK